MQRALALLACALAAGAAGAKTFAWEERVTIHDGSTVALERVVERGAGSVGLPGSSSLRRQSIEVRLAGRRVVWKDELAQPYLMPVIFEMAGGGPVIVSPVYGWFACLHYDFPPEGLAALRWSGGKWTRMPLAELPAGTRKNLLPSPEDLALPQYRGRVVDDALRRQLDYRLGSPGNPEDLAGMVRMYSRNDEACRRMRPPPDPLADAARERIAAAERTALEVRSTLEEESTEPLAVSKEEYRRIHHGEGGARDSCRGVVDRTETVSAYSGGKDRFSSSLRGFRVSLVDEEHKPGRLDFGNSKALMQPVTCAAGVIYVIRRVDATRLILHRFRDDGTLIDAYRIVLPGAERMGGGRLWGGLWDVAVRADGLALTLADYRYPLSANLGGTITHRQVHMVRLPPVR